MTAPSAPAALAEVTQRWLVRLARHEVARAMGEPVSELLAAPEDPRLDEPVRGFVSWYLDGSLQGCIGVVESAMPLRAFVERFAVQAALHDRRTPALTKRDRPRLDFELHLLSDGQPMIDAHGQRLRGLAAIAAALVPEQDGLWLTHPSGARAFFLPSVWEQLPEASDFVHSLARKAGIDPHSAQADACEGAVMRGRTLQAPHSAFND